MIASARPTPKSRPPRGDWSAKGIATRTMTRLTSGNESFAYSSTRYRSEEHTSELQSQFHLVCRLLLEKKNHAVELDNDSVKQLSLLALSWLPSLSVSQRALY